MPRRRLTLMRLPAVVVPALLAVVAACSSEPKPGVAANVNPETTPTMLTRDVETLISDSGITRYRITTPLWLMYDEASEPYWRFPEGVNVIKYNDLLVKEATVRCDSATYLTKPQLWRLDGNVRITSAGQTKFMTNQLYWNQRDHKLYSDSFIRIERPDRTLEGYGFTANERLTSYQIRRVSGIFPANFGQPGSGASVPSAPADTSNNSPRP